MAATDENALICDFAEYYHIYDYRSLPARMAAVLASGLRDESRSRMALEGRKLSLRDEIQVAIYDRLNWLQWAKTTDGAKNINIPKSLLEELTMEKEREFEEYKSGEEFIEAYKKITGGGYG